MTSTFCSSSQLAVGVHDSFLSDMITKTNTVCPFHAHIFVDNNGERESERKKLDCDNQAKLYLKKKSF